MLQQWTTPDFDSLSWHDASVHAFRFTSPNQPYRSPNLELDIDFILEWILQPDRSYHFLLAPALLTFHDVTNLQISVPNLCPSVTMDLFSLDDIEREPLHQPAFQPSYQWRLKCQPSPFKSPAEFLFHSPAFPQRLTRAPIVHPAPGFASTEREC